MASCIPLLQPTSNFSSSSTLLFLPNTNRIPSSTSLRTSSIQKSLPYKSLTVSFALAESDSPKSLEPDPQSLLLELAVSIRFFISKFCFVFFKISCFFFSNYVSTCVYAQDSFDLPPDYFKQLPSDLRLDVSRILYLIFASYQTELFVAWYWKFMIVVCVWSSSMTRLLIFQMDQSSMRLVIFLFCLH